MDYLRRITLRDTGVQVSRFTRCRVVAAFRPDSWRDSSFPGQVCIRRRRMPTRSPRYSRLQFGASRTGLLWNFENAETLVFYCNGPWCGQSPTNIRQLLALGYPAHKLKWYRGGMQEWKSLGLTTVPFAKR
jgi:rhodanese-related sulfurtransferase